MAIWLQELVTSALPTADETEAEATAKVLDLCKLSRFLRNRLRAATTQIQVMTLLPVLLQVKVSMKVSIVSGVDI